MRYVLDVDSSRLKDTALSRTWYAVEDIFTVPGCKTSCSADSSENKQKRLWWLLYCGLRLRSRTAGAARNKEPGKLVCI